MLYIEHLNLKKLFRGSNFLPLTWILKSIQSGEAVGKQNI
ncbi:hypothetical protein HMPREF9225_0356 [Peptoniphilus duerdenii ATCC BAA-1640]|uniref:Uncharacterized protein n=1 Tax=Peptoniphilus duerdenii ATCC BAA-1640 TaxID=862517 RepID=E0NJL7_9FIRM|nr:hypothetical protein HMPREF9225_0356 [Peptoniphilus duerdenii ATCC BAA-1640]